MIRFSNILHIAKEGLIFLFKFKNDGIRQHSNANSFKIFQLISWKLKYCGSCSILYLDYSHRHKNMNIQCM